MTQPATPPVKTVRKRAPEPPPFDYAKLTPKKAAPPVRKSSAVVKDNPTVAWVKASWDGRTKVTRTGGKAVEVGSGQEVTIPKVNAQQFRNLLNYAARDLGVGVSIRTKEIPGNKVVVTFAAVTRKQSKKDQ